MTASRPVTETDGREGTSGAECTGGQVNVKECVVIVKLWINEGCYFYIDVFTYPLYPGGTEWWQRWDASCHVMCLDYRKVNQQLVTDIHPLPNLEELVENVAGSEFYAKLDLKDAYYQVMLDEASRETLPPFQKGLTYIDLKDCPLV